MTCLNFGTRAYDVRDNLGNSHGRWNNSDGDFAYWYNQTPNYTAKTRGSGSMSDDAWKDSGDSENGDCSVPNNTHLGTKFIPCGDCLGGSHWRFCQCCVSNWNPTNKSECCDPTPNNKQNDAIECDVEWCPFSPACMNEPITSRHCLANPLDTTCMNTCVNYLSNQSDAPSWCSGFITNYCKLKNGPTQTMSASDQTLCACMMDITPCDECLLIGCKESTIGTTWITPKQVANQIDPKYCYTQCQNIAQSVSNQTGPINSISFKHVCGEVTLPASDPNIVKPYNPNDTSDPSTFWEKTQHWFKSLPMYVWIIVGIVVFIILFGHAMYKLRDKPNVSVKSTNPK